MQTALVTTHKGPGRTIRITIPKNLVDLLNIEEQEMLHITIEKTGTKVAKRKYTRPEETKEPEPLYEPNLEL